MPKACLNTSESESSGYNADGLDDPCTIIDPHQVGETLSPISSDESMLSEATYNEYGCRLLDTDKALKFCYTLLKSWIVKRLLSVMFGLKFISVYV